MVQTRVTNIVVGRMGRRPGACRCRVRRHLKLAAVSALCNARRQASRTRWVGNVSPGCTPNGHLVFEWYHAMLSQFPSVTEPSTTCLRLQVVFLLAKGCAVGQQRDRVHGAVVRRFATERALLAAWRAYVLQQDPDGLVLFQASMRYVLSSDQAAPDTLKLRNCNTWQHMQGCNLVIQVDSARAGMSSCCACSRKLAGEGHAGRAAGAVQSAQAGRWRPANLAPAGGPCVRLLPGNKRVSRGTRAPSHCHQPPNRLTISQIPDCSRLSPD